MYRCWTLRRVRRISASLGECGTLEGLLKFGAMSMDDSCSVKEEEEKWDVEAIVGRDITVRYCSHGVLGLMLEGV